MAGAIAGYCAFNRRFEPSRACAAQLDTQLALGRDPQIWTGQGLALGRRLFPSVPEDAWDAGPVVRADGGHVLVADARIDNRAELAQALGIGRLDLDRLSDCSLLLDCLLAWDLEALNRMVGDFAFAWWDRRRETLTLGRDYVGQRPLHYASAPGFFAFASMPRGLHALAEVPRRPSGSAAGRFMLNLAQPSSESFFDGVSRVAPGHVVTVQGQRVEDRRWWFFRPVSTTALTLDEAAERARGLLDRAVADRLRGGGDFIASHLSAGLDSSGVTATAARQLGLAGRRLLAYTAVPRGERLEAPRRVIADESALARQVTRQFGNIEHIERGANGSLAQVFERGVQRWERPVPNPFNDMWWAAITQDATDRGARVLLTAPMGNIGLSHSGEEMLPQLLASFRWRALARAIADRRRFGGDSTARLAVATLRRLLPNLIRKAMLAARGDSATGRFVTRSACSSPELISVLRPGATSSLQRRLDLIACTDPGVFNAGELAGWGIEVRDPMADRRLMEFTLGLPTEIFWGGGQGRALARRALADRLPAAVVGEMRKGYQSADRYLVLRENRDELIAEAEAIGTSPKAAEMVDWRALLAALRELPREQPTSRRQQRVYGIELPRALAAGHFLRSGG